MSTKPLIAFFRDIDKNDLPMVGGKGANLGEMTQAKFPVPGGFAITVASYEMFLAHNNLADQIDLFLKDLDVDDSDSLQRQSKKIQDLIIRAPIPDEIGFEVKRAYKKLSPRFKKQLVAVRSSATAEDLPGASFAGQQATFLNIKGDTNLLIAVRECWASLFTARAIFYRKQNKIRNDQVKISVIVQKMVQSDVSGVMFSIDPVTNDKDRIIIEAVWGLGELIVQGSVLPDRYVVQKDTYAILSKEVSEQNVRLIKIGSKTIEQEVPAKIKDKQKISDDEVVALAKLANKLQEHYYFPQDIEWAKEKNDLFITQTRPVTTIPDKNKKSHDDKSTKLAGGETVKHGDLPILSGSSASPGVGTGPAKILKSPKEINKVKEGDVLVAEMTSPDYVPAMKKASAIVTDKGGMTSHAAIVSRELGIPCVVGTNDATKKLKENDIVTVDGTTGNIYVGTKVIHSKAQEESKNYYKGRTATKVYVNLAEVEMAKKGAKLNVDGVGLLRAEFMIANIGIHPKEAIKLKKQDVFIENLIKGMSTFCSAFGTRPIIYRATDFKTNEYRSLQGGESWEPQEPNPMLGFRGAYRYIAQPEVFNLELQAIKEVRKMHKNLWLEIPFVRSPEELAKVRRLVASNGLFEDTSFKFWLMVEIPINVILIDKFLDVGVDGISFGSNDLTMLVTGTDRDNETVAADFDERSPAISWAFKRVIKACNKRGVSSSICGQAPSTYDDLVEELIRYGITSISVNPDAVDRVRNVIHEAERKLAVGK
ncbi:phosphoenolpyruvate synthase [Candidatus Woesebacteria bacterium]|nr:MAG: phosphoenolpyruvate synthase [Candidatus Woesebacteria bacterium]